MSHSIVIPVILHSHETVSSSEHRLRAYEVGIAEGVVREMS
jgi:hypothetical protein